jgi:hypothetical protein
MRSFVPHRRLATVAGIAAAAALTIGSASALAGTPTSGSKQPPKVQHTDFSFVHYADKANAVLF